MSFVMLSITSFNWLSTATSGFCGNSEGTKTKSEATIPTNIIALNIQSVGSIRFAPFLFLVKNSIY